MYGTGALAQTRTGIYNLGRSSSVQLSYKGKLAENVVVETNRVAPMTRFPGGPGSPTRYILHIFETGASGGIRTPNPRPRKKQLYPIELQRQIGGEHRSRNESSFPDDLFSRQSQVTCLVYSPLFGVHPKDSNLHPTVSKTGTLSN
jgi:hypothetical protein